MVSELANYLSEQLQKGYSKQELKTHLLAHNYSPEATNKAFAELIHLHLEQKEPDLKAYVESYLSKGYQAEQLYETLKQQGYSSKLLEKIFKQANTKSTSDTQPKKRWRRPDAIAIMLSLPIIFFILIFVYIYNNPSGELPLVDEVTLLGGNASLNQSDTFLVLQDQQIVSPSNVAVIDYWSNVFLANSSSDAMQSCLLLVDDIQQDSCYQYVAETYNDVKLCINITSTTTQDNCYATFIIAGDETLCDQLSSSAKYSLCATY